MGMRIAIGENMYRFNPFIVKNKPGYYTLTEVHRNNLGAWYHFVNDKGDEACVSGTYLKYSVECDVPSSKQYRRDRRALKNRSAHIRMK